MLPHPFRFRLGVEVDKGAAAEGPELLELPSPDSPRPFSGELGTESNSPALPGDDPSKSIVPTRAGLRTMKKLLMSS